MRECGLTTGLTSNGTRSQLGEFDQTLIERSAQKHRYTNLTMISPADARKLTLDAQAAGDQQILESTEFDITSWSAKHIPPIFTVAFASLGAEDLQDLLGLTETDLEKIEMPPLKRRRILRQIEEDMLTYGLGKPHDDCLLLLSSI